MARESQPQDNLPRNRPPLERRRLWLKPRRPPRASGFTLIEVMIVIAIVAILAVIGVVAYTRHIKKSRIVEAYDMLGQIQSRQEAYFQGNGSYCNISATLYPTVGGPFDAKAWTPASAGLPLWDTLGVRVEKGATYFSYATVAGGSRTGTEAAALGILSDVPSWYYAVARADMANDGDPDTELHVTSVRREIVILNEGK
jgi:prepilin-type N-terminal cleavage/methylation domain-containing protein